MEVARRLGVLVLEWASLALGVFIAGHFGYLTYKDVGTLAVVAIVLGLFNSFLRPFLLAVFMIVSIPILILTLGLGVYLVLFVTNGAILALTANLAMARRQKIDFDPEWFKADSDKCPDTGVVFED